ncbi:hypothetical protein EI94DRAFT_889486 [Lactarius quietus]|nr:hypothetical protein EI94DRAFT_889486 [Lactarius quietus]
MSEVPSTSTSSPNFETIFTAALEEYKKQTKKDIASHPLAAELNSCDSPNAVLTVLQTQVQTFGPSESANERWTKLLDPTVTVLYTFSTFLNNAVGPIFPPAAAIFTGISVLLQAVKDVRASQDVIIELFRRMEFFFKRLEAYIKVRPTTAMMDIIVQIVVEVISILGVVTKEIRQGRIKKYLKTLFGIKRVEDALQRLDKLTQEEARMAQTETLTITHRIDENVIHVGENVEGVNEETHRVHMKVENVSDQLQSVQANVQGVGEEVGLISTGVMEATVEIQLVSKRVSDLNREESRKDLRKWIAPPIRLLISTLHLKLTTKVPRHGAPQGTPSPIGGHPAPCYGFTENPVLGRQFSAL